MNSSVQIGDRSVGAGAPTWVVAEIGLNHNGSLDLALELVERSIEAGADAVKFQKRTPALNVPEHAAGTRRSTPWGEVGYEEYRERIELTAEQYAAIDARCRALGTPWFASAWDGPSVDFLATRTPCIKIPSARLDHADLIAHAAGTGLPLILSTGASTIEDVDRALDACDRAKTVLMHCTSVYPTELEEVNLRAIPALRARFGVPVGYSGHELGILPSVASVALGACMIERHVTLDRGAWGSDHAASILPDELAQLVRSVRELERALGDGEKRVHERERAEMRRIRGR